MFPFHEEKLKWDEDGEFIKHDHFRIEEVKYYYFLSIIKSTFYLTPKIPK